MAGKVVWHSLKKDGSITKYDIRFGGKILRGIPAALVESIKEVQHEHEER
tara:strand:- start:9856 stop:10005 length:150 start_codon:yes stop_codon:yes gene_type:complete